MDLGSKERILSSAHRQPMRKHVDRKHRLKMMRRLCGDVSGETGSEGEEEDLEIARFMSGAGYGGDDGGSGDGYYSGEAKASRTTIATTSTSTVEEEKDMHCVESLLSLSRGTWVARA